MQVEAIYTQGRIELVQPLRLRHDRVRLLVTVPDSEVETPPTTTSDSPTRQAIDGILGTWKRSLQASPPTTLEDMARLQIEALEEKHLGSR